MRRTLKILAVQLAIVLVLLEIALRLYHPIPFRVKGEKITLPVREVVVYRHENARKLDPVTRETRNSIGFRGPDPPADFKNRLTIVTIGGSTTECDLLDDGKTWTDVMARSLATEFPTVWVNNAGLDGHSSYGHLVLLRDIVSELKPRVAVVLAGVNDVAIARSKPVDDSLTPDPSNVVYRVKAFAVDHSEVAALAQNLSRAYRARRAGLGEWEIDFATAPRRDMEDWETPATLDRHRRLFVDAYAHRLAEFIALARRSGIEPVFVTQPALYGDGRDPTTGVDLSKLVVDGVNGALAWRILELYNDAMRTTAAREHVTLIDLGRELPKDSRYFYDFIHFANAGAERVGQIVASGLQPLLRSMAPAP